MKRVQFFTLIFFIIVILYLFSPLSPARGPLLAQPSGNDLLVGEDDTLSSTGDLPPNVWKSLQFVAQGSGTASYFRVFLKDLPNPPNHLHNLGYALYTNNTSAHGGCGNPGTLIAFGTQTNYNWSIIGTDQWHDFPLTQTAQITRGAVYWVAFCSDGGHDGWHFGRSGEQNSEHAERKRGCNTHSWNDIPNGNVWNIIYPDAGFPCTDNGNYSWYFSNGSNALSTTSTSSNITTSISPSTTTSTRPSITTSISPSTTTTLSTKIDTTLNFSTDKTFGFTPLTINFTNLSIGPVNSLKWDFGDGVTSNEQNPSHTYINSGLFIVKLSAYDVDENIEITSKPNLIVALLGCPIATILDNPENLTTLRTFRNHLLKNFFGFILVSLYYQNSDEILKILVNNPDLNDRLDSCISENIYLTTAILNENEAPITETTVQEIIHLLEQFKAHASRKLDEDLSIVINVLNDTSMLAEFGLRRN